MDDLLDPDRGLRSATDWHEEIAFRSHSQETILPNANETLEVVRYWSPIIGVTSVLLLTIALPALKWLWDLKSNHLSHIEASTTEAVVLARETNTKLTEIATILRERK
jgi:hypothetical protein